MKNITQTTTAPRRRLLTTLTLLATVSVIAALTGCAATTTHTVKVTANPVTTGCVPTAAGTISDTVKVTGKFGEKPKVTFTTPLNVKETQRTIVIKGDGKTVAIDGAGMKVNYTVYNGTTGTVPDFTPYGVKDATALRVDNIQLLPGIYKNIHCAVAGDRIVTVIPPVDAFGSTGNPSLNIVPTDNLVFVMDIVSVTAPLVVLPYADGVTQPAVAGLPTVVLGKDHSPTITIPSSTAPTELKSVLLKKGNGATVKESSEVTVHYTGMVWGTGVVFDSSWTNKTPNTFPITQVVPGFSKSVIGQKVGSQVLIIIPPSEGYGSNGSVNAEGTTIISPTDTMVFVVDILGVD